MLQKSTEKKYENNILNMKQTYEERKKIDTCQEKRAQLP